jgi:DNA-directed RNA polymerase specialized sigma24 family protein
LDNDHPDNSQEAPIARQGVSRGLWGVRAHDQVLEFATREDWIDEQATLRESIRAYHDDDGHSWSQTAEHFNMTQGAVRQRAYRARKEREAEAKAARPE